jgi:ribosome-associated protein
MNAELLFAELKFKAVRSSGAGGQNVNKVASKVVLNFDINQSKALTDDEKALLKTKLSTRLTTEEQLILSCDTDRSQLRNKSIVSKRFFDLIAAGLAIQTIRKATKVPKSVIKKRLKDKKTHSEIKQNRRKPEGF